MKGLLQQSGVVYPVSGFSLFIIVHFIICTCILSIVVHNTLSYFLSGSISNVEIQHTNYYMKVNYSDTHMIIVYLMDK